MKPKITLRSKAKELEPVVRIGKSGLTKGMLAEIKRQLKKKKLIKIKLLKSFIKGQSRKDIARNIASLTDSEIIDSVGFTVTLNKK